MESVNRSALLYRPALRRNINQHTRLFIGGAVSDGSSPLRLFRICSMHSPPPFTLLHFLPLGCLLDCVPPSAPNEDETQMSRLAHTKHQEHEHPPPPPPLFHTRTKHIFCSEFGNAGAHLSEYLALDSQQRTIEKATTPIACLQWVKDEKSRHTICPQEQLLTAKEQAAY